MGFERIIHKICVDVPLEKLRSFHVLVVSLCSELRYPGNEMASKDVSPTRMRAKDLMAICD